MNASLSSAAIALADVADWSTLWNRSISPAAIQRVGWVLLHFLWQGSAVAALLVIALRLLSRRSAALRYRVACAALGAMAVAPLVTWCVIGNEMPDMSTQTPRELFTTTADQSGVQFSEPKQDRSIAERTTDIGAAPMMTSAAGGAASARSVWTRIVLCWAAGVAGLSVWRAGGWLHLRRLVRRTAPLGGDWDQRMQALAHRMGVRRTIPLAEAAWVAVPCMIGFFRPIVLVPAAALTGLSPAHFEAILAHELAHIRRHDYLVNLAQAVLETVLFYHPAVWWVSARVREEREYCCDDLAAATSRTPADYADALCATEVLRGAAASSLPPHLALAALGGGRRSGPLLRRVRRVLGLPPGRSRDGFFVPPLTAIAIAAACVAMPWVVARADKLPATAPTAHATPATVPAMAPSTAPADALAGAQPPGPDDLVVDDKQPYLIRPNDLLTIKVSDLTGPGTETVKTIRVKENGTITMSFLSAPVHAAGLTAVQLEKDLLDRYHAANIIQKAQISVSVVEARGHIFKVLGEVPKPGQYAIIDPDFRLLDALKLAGADVTKLDRIYVVHSLKINLTAHDLDLRPTTKAEFQIFHLRNAGSDETVRRLLEVFTLPEDAKGKPAPGSTPYGVNAVSDAGTNSLVVTAPPEAMKVVDHIIRDVDRPQIIVISAKGLAAGDAKLNVVIHKEDTIIVPAPPRSHP